MNFRWSKKNPYLNAWLDGAPAAAGPERGHAGAGKPVSRSAAAGRMAEVVISAWLAPLAGRSLHAKRRR